jgi:hypothetical protein
MKQEAEANAEADKAKKEAKISLNSFLSYFFKITLTRGLF